MLWAYKESERLVLVSACTCGDELVTGLTDLKVIDLKASTIPCLTLSLQDAQYANIKLDQAVT